MQRFLVFCAPVAAGAALMLSYAAPSPGASTPTTYTVHSGDTLWSIAAERYPDRDPRAAIYDIQQSNDDLHGSALALGQKLVLP